MRKNSSFLTTIVLLVMLAVVGCKKDQQGADRDLSAGVLQVQHIPTDACGRIQTPAGTTTLTLSPGTYLLDSVTRVPAGYTLNIPAGTTIKTGTAKTYSVTNPLPPFNVTTRAIAGVLVVEVGGTLNATGTSTSPVVFTSAAGPGVGVAGDFGGVVLLGDAPTNTGTNPKIEGLPNAPCSATANTYGGADVNDNSGTLTYVRIEYPGIRLFDNQEINGLTMGGVGKGTKLEHIEVLYSADDAFEWFGGTVNAKYLLAVGSDDDDFDFDFGYSGAIQFAIALKNPASTHSQSSGVSDSNGIESDNDAGGSTNSPITRPILSNFTVLGVSGSANGSLLEKAAHFRRSSGYAVSNSIFGGFPIGVNFEAPVTSTGSIFTNNLVHGFSNQFTGLTPAGNFGGNNLTANTTLRLTSPAAFFVNPGSPYNTSNLNPAALSAATGSALFSVGTPWNPATSYGTAGNPFSFIATSNMGAIDAAATWNFSTGWAIFPAI